MAKDNRSLVEIQIFDFPQTTLKQRKEIAKYLRRVASQVTKADPTEYSNNPWWTLFR